MARKCTAGKASSKHSDRGQLWGYKLESCTHTATETLAGFKCRSLAGVEGGGMQVADVWNVITCGVRTHEMGALKQLS